MARIHILLLTFIMIICTYFTDTVNAECGTGCGDGYYCVKGTCINRINDKDNYGSEMSIITMSQTAIYVIVSVVVVSFLLCLCYSKYSSPKLSNKNIQNLNKNNLYV
eukprot:168764_1